jgi:hypothetical protein
VSINYQPASTYLKRIGPNWVPQVPAHERAWRILVRLSRNRPIGADEYRALVTVVAHRFANTPHLHSRTVSALIEGAGLWFFKGGHVGGAWDRAYADRALRECIEEGRSVTADFRQAKAQAEAARLAELELARREAFKDLSKASAFLADIRRMQRQLKKEIQREESYPDRSHQEPVQCHSGRSG